MKVYILTEAEVEQIKEALPMATIGDKPCPCTTCTHNRALLALLVPTEVPQSDEELVETLRHGGYGFMSNDPDDYGPNGDDYFFTLSISQAAALIHEARRVPESDEELGNVLEGIFNVEPDLKPKARQEAAALIHEARKIPMAMLNELLGYQWPMGEPVEYLQNIFTVAAKYGREIGG